MRLLIAFLLLLSFPAHAQETTAKVDTHFATAPQEVVDYLLCQKTGERCETEQSEEGCYIDSQPCEEILSTPTKENDNGN